MDMKSCGIGLIKELLLEMCFVNTSTGKSLADCVFASLYMIVN